MPFAAFSLAFYEVAATTIPVLVLAAALVLPGTRNVEELDQVSVGLRIYLVGVVLAFFAVAIGAEIGALGALLDRTASETREDWVEVALLNCGFLIVMGYIVPMLQRIGSDRLMVVIGVQLLVIDVIISFAVTVLDAK